MADWRDRLMRPQRPKLEKALGRPSVPHEVRVYPKAGHSFFTGDQPGPAFKLGKIGPLKGGYCPAESEDSWKRMLAFFAEHV